MTSDSLVIVDGVRTPFCRAGTDFAQLDAVELGRAVVDHLMVRTGLSLDRVDEVIFGCVGQPAEATTAFRDALKLDRNSVEARRGLGNALVAMDEPSLAVPHFKKAMEMAPQDYRPYLGLGVAYDLMGRHEEARETYETGLEASPGNIDLKHNLGLSHVLAGEVEAGLALLREVVASKGAGPQHRQTLAMGLALSGDEEAAADVASLDLDPDSVKRNLAYFRTLRAMRDPAQRLRSIQAFFSGQPLTDS